MNNLNLRVKKITALLGLSVSLVLIDGCSNNSKRSVVSIVDEVEDDTCFDEIMKQNGISIEDIDTLNEYIKLSNKINKLRFKRCTVNNLNNYSLASIDEVREMIDDIDNEDVLEKLTIQEKLINRYIYEVGYSLMEDATEIGIKSKVLDANGLNEDNYSSIFIGNSYYTHYNDIDVNYVDICGYKVSRGYNLYELLGSAYHMDNKGTVSGVIFDKEKYNKDRNGLIGDAIDNLKDVLLEEYKVSKNNVLKKVKK